MPARKLRNCPVCEHEAWPITYGLLSPEAMENRPEKSVYGGCTMLVGPFHDPITGEMKWDAARWECQNPECKHQW